MTIALNRAVPFEEILETFKNIPEIAGVGEDPPMFVISPKLLEKVDAVPKLGNRHRKTIFVTLNRY